MKRAVLTLAALTLAASVAGTPSAAPERLLAYSAKSVVVDQGQRGAPQTTDRETAINRTHRLGAPSGGASTSRTGRASWYAANGNIAAVPWWSFGDEPVWATVTHFRDGQAFSVTVLIQDFCQCYVGTERERLIDLSDDAFRQLAPLSRGVISVTLETPAEAPTLPPTSTEDVP